MAMRQGPSQRWPCPIVLEIESQIYLLWKRLPRSSNSTLRCFRVPHQTVEASGPTVLVARARGLIGNSLMRDDHFGCGAMRFKAYRHALHRSASRLQFPSVCQAMRRIDYFENSHDPNHRPISKPVRYAVGTAHPQITLRRGTGDALRAPPTHQEFGLSPGGEELRRRSANAPSHNECRGWLPAFSIDRLFIHSGLGCFPDVLVIAFCEARECLESLYPERPVIRQPSLDLLQRLRPQSASVYATVNRA